MLWLLHCYWFIATGLMNVFWVSEHLKLKQLIVDTIKWRLKRETGSISLNHYFLTRVLDSTLVVLCCFYKLTEKAMGTYENNACENKNLVFTGSYAKESWQNQYCPYDSLALHYITLHAPNYNCDAVPLHRQGREGGRLVFLNFQWGLSFRGLRS